MISRAQWAHNWCGAQGPDSNATPVEREWKARWWRAIDSAQQRGRPAQEPADFEPIFRSQKAFQKHQGLRKHKSSLLTQIRTGKVGLKAFLFQRKVPEIMTPHCHCGLGKETPAHLAISCPDLAEEQQSLQEALAPAPLLTGRDFATATAGPNTAGIIVQWMLSLGRLPEYRRAVRYTAFIEEGT